MCRALMVVKDLNTAKRVDLAAIRFMAYVINGSSLGAVLKSSH